MNYWIINLPREDMEHCIDIGVYGLNLKQSMASVAIGDQLVCVATKEKPWKVLAFGEVASEYYVDDKAVFRKEGGFYFRFDFKAKRLAPEEEIDLQTLIGDLSFVTNIVYWPVYFKGGLKKISESDWNLIRSKL